MRVFRTHPDAPPIAGWAAATLITLSGRFLVRYDPFTGNLSNEGSQ